MNPFLSIQIPCRTVIRKPAIKKPAIGKLIIRKLKKKNLIRFFLPLLFVLSFLPKLSAQGIPDYAIQGFYEYPIIPDFNTMFYGARFEFNFAGIREVNILNAVNFKHRISSTNDYFPDNVYNISYRILLFNPKILIQNVVSSNSTKPFQNMDDIANMFMAGYNFSNSENIALYIGLIVMKPFPFLGKEFDGIPIPFVFFAYQTNDFSVRILPLDLKWTPKTWVEVRLYGFFNQIKFNTFFYVTGSIYMGPEVEFNVESIRDANRVNKDESIRLMNLQLGARFYIYYFDLFIGYALLNQYEIVTRGKTGAKNKVKPGGGFDFDVGFRFEF